MSGHKFPVSHRLVCSQEFDRVFKKCEFRLGNSALLFLAKPNHQGFNRLGMVVSKKSVPLAARRNRIKRQIREVFRHSLNGEQVGLDIVVLTRPGVRETANLHALLTDSFRRLRHQATDDTA